MDPLDIGCLSAGCLQGLLLVVLAGMLAGSCGAPIKVMRTWRYEHWAFVSQAIALVALPWAATLLLCPDALGALREIDPGLLLKANLLSAAWGVANVCAALCLVRIGFSLTIGILSGIGLPIGVLTPMICRGTGGFADAPGLVSAGGILLMSGVAVALVAVRLVTLAGYGRDAARADSVKLPGEGGFGTGLVMATVAGLLQAGLSFAFVYSQGPISAALLARGAGPAGAGIGVWAVTLPGGALVNLAYPLWLMRRNRSWRVLGADGRDAAWSVVMGILFFAFVAALGQGMRLLGALGASVGFGVYQSVQIGSAQAVGFVAGEWRGIGGRPRRLMLVALGLLLVAVVVMAAGRARG